jgi:hypothetical protein
VYAEEVRGVTKNPGAFATGRKEIKIRSMIDIL